jgi:hypothetical protein
VIEQLLSYLSHFANGQTSYKEFSTVLFLPRDIVEDTNVILDGTCTLRDGDEIRAMIADRH